MNKDVEGAALLPAILLPLLVWAALEKLALIETTSIIITAVLAFNFVWCIGIVAYLASISTI